MKHMEIKKILTSWHIWAGIAAVLAFTLMVRGSELSAVLPFALFLICPLMMIFIMRGHKH